MPLAFLVDLRGALDQLGGDHTPTGCERLAYRLQEGGDAHPVTSGEVMPTLPRIVCHSPHNAFLAHDRFIVTPVGMAEGGPADTCWHHPVWVVRPFHQIGG